MRCGARTRCRPQSSRKRLRSLRAQRSSSTMRGVAELKFEILALLYQDFRERHLAKRQRTRPQFQELRGRRRGCRCSCTRDSMRSIDIFAPRAASASGWLSWPQEYRDVNGSGGGAIRAAIIPRKWSSMLICNGWRTSSWRARRRWRANSACRSVFMATMRWAPIHRDPRPGWIGTAIVSARKSALRPIRWRSRARAGGFRRRILPSMQAQQFQGFVPG